MMSVRFEVYMLLTDANRKKLAKLLVIQGVSARELARAAGYESHSYVQRLLRGEARWLGIEPAVKIATYLGVEVTDLFVPKTSTNSGHTDREKKAS